MIIQPDYPNPDIGSENGRNVREELDDFNRNLLRLNTLISRIRNDQLRALASCRNALCLSCGRGDVNFMPPLEYVKGLDGHYYKGVPPKDPHGFDVGADVFGKEELVKEHTLHSHVPVDGRLQGDLDLIAKARSGRAAPHNRPQTAAAAPSSPRSPALRVPTRLGRPGRKPSPGKLEAPSPGPQI